MKKDKKSEGKVSITTIVKTFGFRSAARGKKKQAAAVTAAEVAKKEAPNSEAPKDEARIDAGTSIEEHNIPAQAFTFRQMASATNNFSSDNLVGEGGFGRVYRGYIQSIDKVVAIKSLDRSGVQGSKDFLSEVFKLSLVSHPSLVNLIGYCADGDQRMLVHEFMANGSLENRLLDLPPNKEPLDWRTRMKIAEGAAKGLQYLHETANPPIIYRDFKTSNILLDEDFNPKLSDFGLAETGPAGDKDVSTRAMGTYGYCAPEYGMTGQFTTKSDIYSFGVVFLELISGRRAIDPTKSTEEQNLVPWAEPLFKDRNMFMKMVDPRLGDKYPVKGLHQALAVAAMCLQEEPSIRPLISDIVTALESLASSADDFESPTKDRGTLTNDPEGQANEPESPTEDRGTPTNDPESHANEPESPTEDRGTPTTDPESQANEPESPTKDSGSPTNDPESQANEPESPTEDSGTPTNDPESQANEPESPTEDRGSPTNDPESQANEPESPTEDRGSPTNDPESQANEPESPTEDRGSPTNDPESQANEPESPTEDRGSPTNDPESQANEPESPAKEPESPVDGPEGLIDGHESQSDEPEILTNDPESATDEHESGSEHESESDELGSPTGIIIRGNDIDADDEAIKR